jgi:hypothetical protein
MSTKTSALPPLPRFDRDASRPARRLTTAAALCRLVSSFWMLQIVKHLVPLRVLARWSWRAPAASSPSVPRSVIVSRVLRAGAIAGVPDRDCLQRSLLLYRELSKHGYGPTLMVGLRRDTGGTAGHAWVSCGSDVIAEPAADVTRFEPILRFGSSGVLVPSTAPARAGMRSDV